MNIEDLDLEFLWAAPEEAHTALKGEDRWEKDLQKYKAFVREEPLYEVIRLLIISYKDQYQRTHWIAPWFLSNESLMELEFEPPYHVLEGQYLSRNDIAKHKWDIRGDFHGERYFYEHIFEFYDTVDWTPLVETSLSDKTYTKRDTADSIVYVVENSPIGEIEVGAKSFRLTINTEHCDSVNKTPLKLEDLNLEFLWAKKGGPILDAPDPFWEKWDDESLKYGYFIKHAPLEQLITILIISFKDQYPRDFWSGALSSEGPDWIDNIKTEGGYEVSESPYICRDDIVKLKWKTREDIHGFDYRNERVFEFKEDIDLIPVVEETLAGKTYTKTTPGARTTYTLKDSPIAKIELRKRSFKMVINHKYYFRRRP